MPRSLPRPRYPLLAEAFYVRQVVRFLRPLDALIRRHVLPVVNRYRSPDELRGDVLRLDDVEDDLVIALGRVRAEWLRVMDGEKLTAAATDAAKKIDKANAADQARIMRSVAIVDVFKSESYLAAELPGWLEQNTDLIVRGGLVRGRLVRPLWETEIDRIGQIAGDGFKAGTRHEQLAKQIRGELGVGRARSVLIARDQTNKLNGQLTRARQRSVGFTHYRWSTAQDRRVRQEHADLQGRIFAWNDPPNIGHPGEPIQCRCVAIPHYVGGAATPKDVQQSVKKVQAQRITASQARQAAIASNAGHLADVKAADSAAADLEDVFVDKAFAGGNVVEDFKVTPFASEPAAAADLAIAEKHADPLVEISTKMETAGEQLAELHGQAAKLAKAADPVKVAAQLEQLAGQALAQLEDVVALDAQGNAAIAAIKKAIGQAEAAAKAAKKAAALAAEKAAAEKAAAAAAKKAKAKATKAAKKAKQALLSPTHDQVQGISQQSGGALVTLEDGQTFQAATGGNGGILSTGLTEEQFLAARAKQLTLPPHNLDLSTAVKYAASEWGDYGHHGIGKAADLLGFKPSKAAAKAAKKGKLFKLKGVPGLAEPVDPKSLGGFTKWGGGARKARREKLFAHGERKEGPPRWTRDDSELGAHNVEALGKLTADERGAINLYSGSSYGSINNPLRDRVAHSYEHAKEAAKRIDKAMKRGGATPEDLTLFRGVNSGHPISAIANKGLLRAGDEFTDWAYSSSSLSETVAQGFAGYGEGGVVMDLTVPKGTKGVWMGYRPGGSALSGIASEKEFLLPRGTTIRIDSFDRTGHNGQIRIRATLVKSKRVPRLDELLALLFGHDLPAGGQRLDAGPPPGYSSWDELFTELDRNPIRLFITPAVKMDARGEFLGYSADQERAFALFTVAPQLRRD